MAFSSGRAPAAGPRLVTCGPRAELLCGMWDPPGPGIVTTPPALAGGVFPTKPPGEPQDAFVAHSPADGYLGGPQVLAIVSSAAVNIRVQVFF